VLVEGLPGIGLVANIACLHLIRELKAQRFCNIYSPHFQAMALTNERGGLRPPVNELYAAKIQSLEHDMMILYGNTQASSSQGQYELYGRVLDVAQDMGCRRVITIGGLKRDYPATSPGVYCAATDKEIFEKAVGLGAKLIQGRIFGAAGVLLGLAQVRGLAGLCILVDTLGLYPDAPAARVALSFLSKYLGLEVDFARLDEAVRITDEMLQGFVPGQATPKTELVGLP